jgi:hypothetical protein
MMAGEQRMEVTVSSTRGVMARCLDCGADESFTALAAASQWCWDHECKPKIGRLSAPVIEGEVIEDPVDRYPKPLQRRLGMLGRIQKSGDGG